MQQSGSRYALLKKLLAGKKILFVMHIRIPFFLNIFRNFTSPQCATYTTIEHPLYPLKGTQSKLTVYKKRTMQRQVFFPRIRGPYTLNFLKDCILTVFWGIKGGVVYDLAFGANNLNTLSLLILKKLGKVKEVIFISIDYTPNRYDNPLLDKLYHWIDRICCYHADVIWNSSGRMNEARIKNGVNAKRITHTIVVPDGCNFDRKKLLPTSRIERKKIIFLGHMRPVMGVELILDSMKEIVQQVPGAHLVLIGGGPKLDQYIKLAQQLELSKYVTFTGFIENHEDVDDIIRTGAIGLAPFVPDKSSYEYYSDVGKPKAYLAAGMPVIITRVPEIAYEIESKKAGIAIEYSKEELVHAIVTLLKNDRIYRVYRKNAVKLSKKYIWRNIFIDTYVQTLNYFYK